MKDFLTYKGFIGSVHFSAEDKVFHGKIEGIDDLVIFEGTSVEELIQVFHTEVDDYITLCKEMGKESSKSYKGSFNIRISPELHKKAAEKAKVLGMTLNKFIQYAIQCAIEKGTVEKIN